MIDSSKKTDAMSGASEVRLIAILKAKPEHEDSLRRRLMELVGPTRREQGCREYTLHEDTDHPGEFVFYEIWASQADLDRHMATPPLQALFASLDSMLAEPLTLRKLRVAG